MSRTATPTAIGAGAARVLPGDRLARRAAAGDKRAFAAIFDRYHQRLYRYCLAIVGEQQDAQDALQNTMVKVLRALPGEERRIELKPWLYRIAHNESIELLRRRRETRALDPEQAAPGAGLAEEAASRERLRLLIADLEELPERQRGALVMRELSGLDFAEIGSALGTSAAVARQTLYEARLGLRQMDEGREMSCETVTRALSDGDGRVARRRDLRAHLRACADCRGFREEIEGRERDLAALSPLPALAAAGLLQGVLGGQGVAGGGLAATLGGGAAKTLGGASMLKGAATVAVVAAIGVGAADRGGLIDAVPGGGAPTGKAERPAGAAAGGAAAEGAASQISDPSAEGAAGGAGAVLGGGRVGPSRAIEASAASETHRGGGGTNAAATPAPTSPGSTSLDHPSGKGHEKQLPSAADHGRQTAAAHKADGRGTGGNKGQSGKKSPAGSKGHAAQPGKQAQSAKPPHSAKPSDAGAEKDLPTATGPPANGAQSGSAAAAPAIGAEATEPQSETGEKP